MLISNEVPNFNDPSGALPGRFIKLQFRRSFAGSEDVNLRVKLESELPGIAARCAAAYQRLCSRGYFIQPKTSDDLEQAVAAASNPFAAAVRACFVPDPDGIVSGAIVAAQHITARQVIVNTLKDHRISMIRQDEANKVQVKGIIDRIQEVDGYEHVRVDSESGVTG
jgi:phage/plasmid-associated DNA primase